jgi:hypothetical protein
LQHESVALKARKVRTHRVISQVQRARQIVYGGLSRPEELKDFSPSTFEQAVSPAYIFH